MIETIIPEFYPDFACKAGQCQHSCCRGWEIDIDKETAARYQSLEGPMGELLRQNMLTRGEASCFRMDEAGKCPFLQTDGLCQIIHETSEENLCVICTMHPRFFTYVGNYELAGTGLSCERTVELLLSTDAPLRFSQLLPDGQAAGPFLDLPALLKGLGVSVPVAELQYEAAFTRDDAQFVLDCLARTEPIDEAWQQLLTEIESGLPGFIEPFPAARIDSGRFNRIFHYILYRQLEQAAAVGLTQVLSFACLNTDFIVLASLAIGDLHESLRRWSEQIEYDTDNVARLYSLL